MINNDPRLYCIFSKESIKAMGGNRGKMSAQAGHAFLHAFWNSEKCRPSIAKEYKDSLYHGTRAYKIVLICDTNEDIKEIHEAYKDLWGTSLVIDQAHTVFNEPTMTCLGIGPIYPNHENNLLKNLKVFI